MGSTIKDMFDLFVSFIACIAGFLVGGNIYPNNPPLGLLNIGLGMLNGYLFIYHLRRLE